jgi:hypothetical protein
MGVLFAIVRNVLDTQVGPGKSKLNAGYLTKKFTCDQFPQPNLHCLQRRWYRRRVLLGLQQLQSPRAFALNIGYKGIVLWN